MAQNYKIIALDSLKTLNKSYGSQHVKVIGVYHVQILGHNKKQRTKSCHATNSQQKFFRKPTLSCQCLLKDKEQLR